MYGQSWKRILPSSHRKPNIIINIDVSSEVVIGMLEEVEPGVVGMDASCHEIYHIES
jgi:hypothetical protein